MEAKKESKEVRVLGAGSGLSMENEEQEPSSNYMSVVIPALSFRPLSPYCSEMRSPSTSRKALPASCLLLFIHNFRLCSVQYFEEFGHSCSH